MTVQKPCSSGTFPIGQADKAKTHLTEKGYERLWVLDVEANHVGRASLAGLMSGKDKPLGSLYDRHRDSGAKFTRRFLRHRYACQEARAQGLVGWANLDVCELKRRFDTRPQG